MWWRRRCRRRACAARSRRPQAIVGLESQLLDLLRRQNALGQIAEADVVAQEAALAQAQANLPPLQKQLALERDLLTALAGRLPSEEVEQRFDLAGLELPQELPVSLPARLVEQRPDMQAAAASLHEASAAIGVAIANRLPQPHADGQRGGDGGAARPAVHAGHRLLEHRRQPDAADLRRRHACCTASARRAPPSTRRRRNIAAPSSPPSRTSPTALRALQFDADALKAAVASEHAAAESLASPSASCSSAPSASSRCSTPNRPQQTARIALVLAQANRFADTAALFQALGGGWWNRTDVAEQRQRPPLGLSLSSRHGRA